MRAILPDMAFLFNPFGHWVKKKNAAKPNGTFSHLSLELNFTWRLQKGFSWPFINKPSILSNILWETLQSVEMCWVLGHRSHSSRLLAQIFCQMKKYKPIIVFFFLSLQSASLLFILPDFDAGELTLPFSLNYDIFWWKNVTGMRACLCGSALTKELYVVILFNWKSMTSWQPVWLTCIWLSFVFCEFFKDWKKGSRLQAITEIILTTCSFT